MIAASIESYLERYTGMLWPGCPWPSSEIRAAHLGVSNLARQLRSIQYFVGSRISSPIAISARIIQGHFSSCFWLETSARWIAWISINSAIAPWMNTSQHLEMSTGFLRQRYRGNSVFRLWSWTMPNKQLAKKRSPGKLWGVAAYNWPLDEFGW